MDLFSKAQSSLFSPKPYTSVIVGGKDFEKKRPRKEKGEK